MGRPAYTNAPLRHTPARPGRVTSEQAERLTSPFRKRTRGRLVGVLVVLASVLAFSSVLAIWTERQALNTDDWVDASGELLQDSAIRQAVASYLVDQLYANVNVRKEIRAALPRQVDGLAGPASAGLRQVAGAGADRVLQTSTAQDLWETANREAHQQLLAVLAGGNRSISTNGGTVRLNLGNLLLSLISELGIGPNDVALPPDAGQITILHSDQLETAQRIANGIRGLALLLVLMSFVAIAAAIYLSPRGERWITVIYAGLGLVAAGFAVIVARHVAGQLIVDDLVTDESVRSAATHAWTIGTSMMISIAITVIVLGALFAAAGWLGSPTSSARTTRRAMAPTLVDHAGYFYGALGLVLGLYFLWAPTHGLRALLTTVALGGLTAVGIHHLRRQAAQESPNVGRTDVVGQTRKRIVEFARRFGGRAREPGPSKPDVADAGTVAREARIDHLERLANLREKGILTEEELAHEKAEILGLSDR